MKQRIINLLKVLNKKSDGQLVGGNIFDYVDKIIEKATINEIIKENELIAFIAYYDDDIESKQAFLTMLAVKPEFQNRGYAGKLLKEAISNLEIKGFKYFGLEVLKNNKEAIEFYIKHGFYDEESRESKYFMKKTI